MDLLTAAANYHSPVSVALLNLLVPNLFLATCLAYSTSPNVFPRLFLWALFVLISLPGLVHFAGDPGREYVMGVIVGSGVVYALHLFLVNPILTYRANADTVDPLSLSFAKRLYWGLCVILSSRGVGWNYEAPNLPPRPKLTRWKFVAWSLIRAALFFLFLDITRIYIDNNPHINNAISSPQTIIHFCLLTFCWVFGNVCMINVQYFFCGAVIVALGLSDPHLWPPLYGNPLEAFTVRRLWSRTWHQMMRRQHSGLGKMTARAFGLQQGGLASRYTQLYLAFALSGFTHALGDLKMAPLVLPASLWSLLVRGGIPFFMTQALAITMEDAAIAFFKRFFVWLKWSPPMSLLRAVGYIWTFTWFITSWGRYYEFNFQAGVFDVEVHHFSPIRSFTLLLPNMANINVKDLSQLILVCIGTFILWEIADNLRKQRKYTHVPIVGPRIGFLNSFKSMMYGTEMCLEGFNKYGLAPFRYRITTGWVTLISDPAMATELLKGSDELMQPYEVNDEVLQVRYTLGDHFVRDQYQNEVTRIGMNRYFKEISDDVLEELAATFRDEMQSVNERQWTEITIYDVVKQISSRASNRLFVGLPLCRDPRYIEFTIRNSFDIFQSATAINLFPTWLQPFVAPLLAKHRQNTREGAEFWLSMVQERLNSIELYGKEYPGRPNDALSWLLDESNEQRRKTPDIISRLLFLNFAGIFSTGLTIMRVIHDLIRHDEYLLALREEVEKAIDTHGFTAEALDDMYKLDSFARESARLSPLNTHTMLRRVRRDYTFSNGFSVRAGSRLALNQPALNRSEITWPGDPLSFKGFRHADATKPTSRLVSTHNLLLFGHGRHTCAGRALAAEEIKATLAYLISNYDIKAADENDLKGPSLPIFKLMSMKVSLRTRKL